MTLLGTEMLRSGKVTDADGRAVNIDAGGIGDSFGTTASITSPAGSGSQLVALAGIVAGAVYRVRVVITLTGTAETALANAVLRQNGLTVAVLPTISAAGPIAIECPRVTAASTTMTVTATAAAVAGAVYTVSLVATRIE